MGTTDDDDEATMEEAWRATGDFKLLAVAVAECRIRKTPPPEWLHRALLGLAYTQEADKPWFKKARQYAIRLTRYTAVCKAHDEGHSWETAKEIAAERLHGQPAAGSADTLWADWKKMRGLMKATGIDDPIYLWGNLLMRRLP